jgi:hypothetical protein
MTKSILMRRREGILKLKQNHETNPGKICKVLSCDISQQILTDIFKENPELNLKEIFTRKIIIDIEKRFYKICRTARNKAIVALALYFSCNLTQWKACKIAKSTTASLRNILRTLHLNRLLPIMIKYKIYWLRRHKWELYTNHPHLDVAFQKKYNYAQYW